MIENRKMSESEVHCRIGSSEIALTHRVRIDAVHCRIGSSENLVWHQMDAIRVHCRIGSSEMCLSMSPR